MSRRASFAVALVLIALAGSAAGEAQRASAQLPLRQERAIVTCPAELGYGVNTPRLYCDVVIGRDPAEGVVINIPPHAGQARLTFDLHNRHLFSEELIKAERAYRRYTASIGVLEMDNTLVSRAVIQSEFRTPTDLVDRIAGDADVGGLKAVAPTGVEPITVLLPAGVSQVSILGERLTVIRPEGVDNFTTPGRPIAVISNVMVEYRPAPARPGRR